MIMVSVGVTLRSFKNFSSFIILCVINFSRNASKISQKLINFWLKIRTTLVRTTFMSHDYDDAQLTWNKVIK